MNTDKAKQLADTAIEQIMQLRLKEGYVIEKQLYDVQMTLYKLLDQLQPSEPSEKESLKILPSHWDAIQGKPKKEPSEPSTEISDEEIERLARNLANIQHDRPIDEEERYYKNYQLYDGIVLGLKWYREKIKKRHLSPSITPGMTVWAKVDKGTIKKGDKLYVKIAYPNDIYCVKGRDYCDFLRSELSTTPI